MTETAGRGWPPGKSAGFPCNGGKVSSGVDSSVRTGRKQGTLERWSCALGADRGAQRDPRGRRVSWLNAG